jgi:dipeptidyl aminopeptidase/acylaminoacyl peptidase
MRKAAQQGPTLNPLESFTFTASNGRRIHSFLVKPPGFDPKQRYPLLVGSRRPAQLLA